MPPLEKDIVVYRYVRKVQKEYTPGEVETFKGYLSTSFDDLFVSSLACVSGAKNVKVMKIHVPKGKKAVYIPSDETELLFPHNTQMVFTGITMGFVCFKGERHDPKEIHILDDVEVYNWQML